MLSTAVRRFILCVLRVSFCAGCFGGSYYCSPRVISAPTSHLFCFAISCNSRQHSRSPPWWHLLSCFWSPSARRPCMNVVVSAHVLFLECCVVVAPPNRFTFRGMVSASSSTRFSSTTTPPRVWCVFLVSATSTGRSICAVL